MNKDNIINPSRLGTTDAIFAGKNYDEALGINKIDASNPARQEIRLTMSKDSTDKFFGDEVVAMIIDPAQAAAIGKALIELAGAEFNHISDKDFQNLQEGDKIILRKDKSLYEMPNKGVHPTMLKYAGLGMELTVTDTSQIKRGHVYAKWEFDDEKAYVKENISQVIKAPTKHYNVAFNGLQFWYEGSGGKITTKRSKAAKMNKEHADNVVKKYGGKLMEVK